MKLHNFLLFPHTLFMYLLIGGYLATPIAWAQVSGACVDISGPWGITETITVTCLVGDESDTFNENASGNITINQTGCDISYIAPGINATRTGTINQNTVQLSGILVVFSPSVTTHENIINLTGILQDGNLINMPGNGQASGTFNAESTVSCTGSTVARFRRKHPYLIPIIQLILYTDE